MNIKPISSKEVQSSFDMEFQSLTESHHFNGNVAIERVTLQPSKFYEPHFHIKSDAFLIFLEGCGEIITEDGTKYGFDEGSTVYFPANVKHGFITKTKVVFITVQSPPILDLASGDEDFHFD